MDKGNIQKATVTKTDNNVVLIGNTEYQISDIEEAASKSNMTTEEYIQKLKETQ